MACVYGNRRNCKQSKSYFGHAHGYTLVSGDIIRIILKSDFGL